jgi:hypothetical protein
VAGERSSDAELIHLHPFVPLERAQRNGSMD